MANLKDFFNKVKNSDRIFTREEIGEMSSDEFRSNEKAIDYQLKEIGVPASSDLSVSEDVVFVHSYTRDDGTKVKSHYRSKQGRMHVSGAAADISKSDFSQQSVHNPFVIVNNYLNKNRPDARELANISLVHPDKVSENNEYKYVKSGFAEMINKTYDLSGNKKIDKDMEGIVFNENSTLSVNVSNSKQLQEQIKKQFNVNSGKFNSDKLEINFTDDANLHLSVGHGTILKPALGKDGYFYGVLYDKYDFTPKYNDYKANVNDAVIWGANNAFALMQSINYAKKYYVLAPIKFKW